MKMRSVTLMVVMFLTVLCFYQEGSAKERLIQSSDSGRKTSESSSQEEVLVFHHVQGDVKQLHGDGADRMMYGENYIELPIKLVNGEWEFNPEVEFLHRFYTFDMIKIEIRQRDGEPKGYSVLLYAKKAYHHVIFPGGWYHLDRTGKMIVKLVGNTDKEKAFDVYRVWKYLFGL